MLPSDVLVSKIYLWFEKTYPVCQALLNCPEFLEFHSGQEDLTGPGSLEVLSRLLVLYESRRGGGGLFFSFPNTICCFVKKKCVRKTSPTSKITSKAH